VKVAFIYAVKDQGELDREFVLAKAFLAGVEKAGDEIEFVTKSEAETDAPVVCMVGVKSLKVFRKMREQGKQVIYFDKGYFRHRGAQRTWEYWRVAINDHHPTSYVTTAKHTPLRWEKTAGRRAIAPKAWRENGGHIVYAGSSEKYHAFSGLVEPTEYAQSVVRQLRKLAPDRRIIYRPKPTWFDAVPIRDTVFSGRVQSIHEVLQGAWCLVTDGSNASFDAVIEGIPCIVLGNAIAKPISSQVLDAISAPRLAAEEQKLQWFSNLAWCQFTEAEMTDGLAWNTIRPQLEGGFIDESQLKEVAGKGMRPSKALLKKTGLWKGKGRPKRTKEEQRRLKPFTKADKRGQTGQQEAE
jgi:hypothetical protein